MIIKQLMIQPKPILKEAAAANMQTLLQAATASISELMNASSSLSPLLKEEPIFYLSALGL